jgi:hypothetical protein
MAEQIVIWESTEEDASLLDDALRDLHDIMIEKRASLEEIRKNEEMIALICGPIREEFAHLSEEEFANMVCGNH